MNQKRAGWKPRAVAGSAGDETGRVLTVETGLVRVVVRGHVVRATVGAELLAAIAQDPSNAPRAGDRVQLLAWCDGRVTVERVVVRALRD